MVTKRGMYVFSAPLDHYPAIVRYDPRNGTEKIIRTVNNDGLSFTATSDGETIYFTSLTQTWLDPADPLIVSDLFRLDVKTGAVTQLTSGAHLWQPCISPDGSRLVAVQGSGPYSRLVSVDPATGAVRVLFSWAEANVSTPVFSPDGRRLAFTLNVRGYQNIYVADYEKLLPGSMALTDSNSPVESVNRDAAAAVLGPDPFGEYFPSFLDDYNVLFSSDREGSLSLYRASLSSAQVVKVLDDPVAVISAVVDGDSLVYSSYSSNGRCLRTVPLSSLGAEQIPADQGAQQELPEAFTWAGASVPSHGYTDWPAPLLWLPFPTVTRTSPGSPGVELGLGAAAYGASLLGTTTWLADAGWSFASQQPFGGVTITSALGPFVAAVGSQLAYQYTDQYSQTLDSSVSLSLPVINDLRLRHRSAALRVTRARASRRAGFLCTVQRFRSVGAPGRKLAEQPGHHERDLLAVAAKRRACRLRFPACSERGPGERNAPSRSLFTGPREQLRAPGRREYPLPHPAPGDHPWSEVH